MELENVNTFKVEDILTNEIRNSINEIQQPRSRFQLEHFVLNQHDTDEMRFYQCVLEIQSMRTTLRVVMLEMQKNKIEIQKLKESNNPVDAIDAQIKEIYLEESETILFGTIREFKHLIALYNSFPKKYTRDEIDTLQPVYWTKRLFRQVELDNLGNRGTVNPAHLDALRQIGELDIDALIGVKQDEINAEIIKREIS